MSFVNKLLHQTSWKTVVFLYFIGGNTLLSFLVRILTRYDELENVSLELRNIITYALILFSFMYNILSFGLVVHKIPKITCYKKAFIYCLYILLSIAILFFASYTSPISVLISYI